jgi:protein SDA1
MVRHNNQLPDNLPQLQNLIKRDPASYKEEVRCLNIQTAIV